MWALIVLQLWTSLVSRDPPNVLEHGVWSSCYQADDNSWSERALDYCSFGRCQWSLHLGPYDEFALYRWADRIEGEHFHGHGPNLLLPEYHVREAYNRGNRTWTVPSLHLWVNISLQHGSRYQETNQCKTYLVMVKHQ